jgi:transcriptional regulator GlxA family with amidase domain
LNVISFVLYAITFAMLKKIVLLTYDGAQLLDMAGPASAFAEANEFAEKPAYEVVIASPNGGEVRARGGIGLITVPALKVNPSKVHTLLVSGGIGEPLARVMDDKALAAWFRRVERRAVRVGSTCTGAFALASWGVLDGGRATTHWQAIDHFQARYPSVEVDRQALFVVHGHVWTSAGVSTGIDMALAMIEQDLGRHVATSVAQRLVLQMRRPGHQSQFSSVLKAQGGQYSALVEWMSANLQADLSLNALAERANQTLRTFCRRFAEEVGSPPAAFVERLRLERARALLESGELAKRAATESGFGSLDRLWRAFNRAYGLNPSAYRAMHAR